MKIIKLILKGYKRLFLNNIEEVIYTPKEIVQIILGENGSGKSSIMKELNPLPADLKKEFKDNGYKLVIIEHNNKEYEISSGYVAKGKHSFIVDGNELNPGGTKRVQLDLVYQHFGLTPKIFQILLGIDKLTTMSVNDRKKWFTEMSKMDYTFAINLFNKLKQKHRDIIGGIKLLQDNIIKLEDVSKNGVSLEVLEETIDYLKTSIELALRNYDHLIKDSDYNPIKDLIELLNKVKTHKVKMENISTTDIRLLEEMKNKLETKIEYLKRDLVTKQKMLENITSDGLDINKLKSEIEIIKNKLTEIEKQNILDIDLKQIKDIKESFDYIKPEVMEILSELNRLSDYKTDKEYYANLKREVNELERVVKYLETKLNKLIGEIDTQKSFLNDENKIVCSNCGAITYFKFDEKGYKESILERDKTIKELDSKQSKLLELKSLLEKVEEKIRLKDKLRNLIMSDRMLVKIWSYLFTKYESDSDAVVNELSNISILLDRLSEYHILNEKLTELTNKLKLEEEKETLKNEFNLSKEKLEEEISELTQEINNNIDKLNYVINSIKIVGIYNDELEKLRKSIKDVYKYRDRKVLEIRNEYIMKYVSILKEALLEVEEDRNKHKEMVNKLAEYKKQLEELKDKEKRYKILVDEMSPNKGLIAKSINSFLNVFIENMNKIINSIWSYKIELLPCDIEGNDLDYKFKVKVNDDEVINDVSMLSSSMQEIIDLAFRIVFTKFMKLDNMPMYLDEFGRTFDAHHRISAYNVIDSIMSNTFNQIFIVSHFESMYGRFVNADINIISTNNIDISTIDEYNKNLILK